MLSGRGLRAGRDFGTAPRIKAGRRERAEENAMETEARRRSGLGGGAEGWMLSKIPFPVFPSSLRPVSPRSPTTTAKRHTAASHESAFTVIKEEGLHIRPG